MKSKKKYVLSVAFFVILLLITFYLLLKTNDISDIISSFNNVNLKYTLAGFGLVFIYVFIEAIYIKLTLKPLGSNCSLWKGFVYSCTEFYFSAITPSSTGGQPAQAYYMAKDNIPFTKSSVVLLLNTITFKLVLIILGAIACIFFPNLIFTNGTLFTVIFVFGIIVNIAVIASCLMLMYSKKLVNKFCTFFITLGAKLHVIKNKDEKIEKLNSHLLEYQECAKYIKEHINVAIRVIALTLLQRVAFFSTSFVVYKAFGLTGYSYTELVIIQIAIALAIDSLPLPGGVGASEAMMCLLYTKVFGKDLAVSAMLLTRGISYYFCLILSGTIVLINHLQVTFKLKSKSEENK